MTVTTTEHAGPPMDVETCFERLVQLALANVEALARKSDARRLAEQINRDAEIVRRAVDWCGAMDAAVFMNAEPPQPPRLDLAAGALEVAMKTTTDPEVKPWLQTALDFISGDYEAMDDGEEDRELTPEETTMVDAAWERHKAAGPK